MKKYAIVAIGYNRPQSLKRLLYSLENAYYGTDKVPLIISIDNSGNDAVQKCAEAFHWSHGPKNVVTYPERQGLRKHILHCGDFLYENDAIAVFEDDVVAASGYYNYMKTAVEKYWDDKRIAGISFYNHLWNVHVDMPFEPAPSPYDTYFMQFAQSWGQVWLKNQWFDFKKWYEKNDTEFGLIKDVPTSVCNWPKSSWLKYHIRYCIEKNMYFVYPYIALSTCFSDAGEHWKVPDTHLQVPMLSGKKDEYRFPDFQDSDCVVYDAFFERRWLFGKLNGIDLSDASFNLYGYKESTEGKKYVISMKTLPYYAIASFGLSYRPHEQNVILSAQGNAIFLYDTYKSSQVQKSSIEDVDEFKYRFRIYGKTKILFKCICNKMISTAVAKRNSFCHK